MLRDRLEKFRRVLATLMAVLFLGAILTGSAHVHEEDELDHEKPCIVCHVAKKSKTTVDFTPLGIAPPSEVHQGDSTDITEVHSAPLLSRRNPRAPPFFLLSV